MRAIEFPIEEQEERLEKNNKTKNKHLWIGLDDWLEQEEL